MFSKLPCEQPERAGQAVRLPNADSPATFSYGNDNRLASVIGSPTAASFGLASQDEANS